MVFEDLLSLEKTPDLTRFDGIVEALEQLSKDAQAVEDVSACLRAQARARLMRYDAFEVRGDSGKALSLAKEALHVLPERHPDRADALLCLARCRLARYSQFGQNKDLSEMLTLSEELVKLCPAGHPRSIEALENAAGVFHAVYLRTDHVASLDAAISLRETILGSSSLKSEERSEALLKLANMLFQRSRFNTDGEDLDRALSECRGLLPTLNVGSDHYIYCVHILAVASLARWNARKDPLDLAEELKYREEKLKYSPIGHPAHLKNLRDLAYALHAALDESPTLCNSDRLLSCYEELLAALPVDHPDRESVVLNFAAALSIRKDLAPSTPDESRKYVELREEALRLCDSSDKDKYATRQLQLAMALEMQYETPELQVLDRIIDLRRAAIAASEGVPPPSYLPNALPFTATCLGERYGLTRDTADLREAVGYLKRALSLMDDKAESDERIEALNSLGVALYTLIHDTGDFAECDYLVQLHREALSLCEPGNPLRSETCENLARALHTSHSAKWKPPLIEEAVALHREAVLLAPNDPEVQGMLMCNLSRALVVSHLLFHQGDVLDEALEWAEKAAALLKDGPERIPCIRHLAVVLYQRFLHDGADIAGANRAAQLMRDGLATAESPKDRALCLDILGTLNRYLYDVDEDLEKLMLSIGSYEEALALDFTDAKLRLEIIQGLTTSLSTRYQHLEDIKDMQRAIFLQKDGLKTLSPSHAEYPACLSQLADFLLVMFRNTGDSATLEEGIALCQKGKAEVPAGGLGRIQVLAVYSRMLRLRYSQTLDPRDLQELAYIGREMLDFNEGAELDFSLALLKDVGRVMADDEGAFLEPSPDMQPLLGGFSDRYLSMQEKANVHRRRFETSQDSKDIDMVITTYHDALEWVVPNGPHFGDVCETLAHVYHDRFPVTNSDQDMQDAITWMRKSVRASTRLAKTKMREYYLASFLIGCYGGREGDRTPLSEAWTLLEGVARSVQTDVNMRFHAAMTWAVRAATTGFIDVALKAFRLLFTILPNLAWLGSDTRASIHAIHQARYLPVEAATFALRHSTVEEAVEFLEAGRTVIWTQATRLRRPVDSVAAVAPALASRLHDLSEQLRTWSDRQPTSASNEIILQSTLRTQWSETVDEIRKLPGLEQFLGATPYATLKEVSRDGPVVILLDHESCCSAIVLASPNVEPKCVPLTVTVKKLVALHARMKKVADSRGRTEDNLELGGDPGADTAYRAPRATRPKAPADTDVLGTLWDEVAQPIIQHLTGLRVPVCPQVVRSFRLLTICVSGFGRSSTALVVLRGTLLVHADARCGKVQGQECPLCL